MDVVVAMRGGIGRKRHGYVIFTKFFLNFKSHDISTWYDADDKLQEVKIISELGPFKILFKLTKYLTTRKSKCLITQYGLD